MFVELRIASLWYGRCIWWLTGWRIIKLKRLFFMSRIYVYLLFNGQSTWIIKIILRFWSFGLIVLLRKVSETIHCFIFFFVNVLSLWNVKSQRLIEIILFLFLFCSNRILTRCTINSWSRQRCTRHLWAILQIVIGKLKISWIVRIWTRTRL